MKVKTMPKTIIVFDTETTGLPDRAGFDKSYPPWAIAHYSKCRIIQLAYAVYEIKRGGKYKLVAEKMFYVRPDGWTVPPDSFAIHGKSTEFLMSVGRPLHEVMAEFERDLKDCLLLVGHNAEFDKNAVAAEAWRCGKGELGASVAAFPCVCTMRAGKEFCGALNDKGQLKFPRLAELYAKMFGAEPANQHDALGDVRATAACYFQLQEMMLVI
jgi:DNA polymerase-3 subunit alpha/DNA polymerase-3 subunit epsilon